MNPTALESRVVEPELMDQPGLDPIAHDRALRALARVNGLSLTARRVWREVEIAHRRSPGRPVRLLDVACGGGDVLVSVAGRARRSGIQLEAHGCDLSPHAIAHAEAAAEREGAEVRFFQADVVSEALPGGFDIATCSLFLHHLEDTEATALLGSLAQSAHTVLVQDLLRTRAGLALAWGVLRVISRSRIAQIDGPRSVRAAFTLEEVRDLAHRAGLTRATIRRSWPERFVLRRCAA